MMIIIILAALNYSFNASYFYHLNLSEAKK